MAAHHGLPLGPLSYDANASRGDSGAEADGGFEEVDDALARIHAGHTQDDRPARGIPSRLRKASVPLGEIDGLGHGGQLVLRNAVLAAGDLAGIAARRDHEVRALGVLALPARLDGEQGPGHAALVPELVGDHALQAHHERRAARSATEEEAVEIDAVDEIDAPRRPQGDAGVVEPAIEGVKTGTKPQRPNLEAVAQRLEAACKSRDADERATPLPRVGWRGGEDGDAQGLLPLEDRLPLLQERARAFRVVLAVERLDAHLEEL